eukprot:3256945-Rhodomonas_salina.1
MAGACSAAQVPPRAHAHAGTTGPLSSYARAMGCPVLVWRALRMSRTERAYGALHTLNTGTECAYRGARAVLSACMALYACISTGTTLLMFVSPYAHTWLWSTECGVLSVCIGVQDAGAWAQVHARAVLRAQKLPRTRSK